MKYYEYVRNISTTALPDLLSTDHFLHKLPTKTPANKTEKNNFCLEVYHKTFLEAQKAFKSSTNFKSD